MTANVTSTCDSKQKLISYDFLLKFTYEKVLVILDVCDLKYTF